MDGLDIERLYDALGFLPNYQNGVWDQGDCILPQNSHDHGGRNKLGFHREQHWWHCWGCGSYSLLNFVKAVKGFQNKEDAGRWLAQFGSLDEIDRLKRKADRLWLEAKEEHDPIPVFNPDRLDEWGQYHPWIEKRGIHKDIAHSFSLRYAPDAIIGSYEGPAIVLPHFWHGSLVGWQYRWLDPPSGVPKYSFTKQFPRRQTLWGYDFVDSSPLIVVESVPTALRLISLGFSSIATFGCNVSSTQINLLRGFLDGVIIAPDNDSQGKKFAELLTTELSDFIPLWQVDPPAGEGEDLGDYWEDDYIYDAIERRKIVL